MESLIRLFSWVTAAWVMILLMGLLGLLVGATVAVSGVAQQSYVRDSGVSLGSELAKNITLIEATVSEVGAQSITLSSGSASGVEREMLFELKSGTSSVLFKVTEAGPNSATAKLLNGKELSPDWKGAKVTEAPTIGVAGFYDEIVEGYDDFSRDLSTGVFNGFRASDKKEVAPLAAIEPVADKFIGTESREAAARKAIFDATGSSIIVVGSVKKETASWVVTAEALDWNSGKVRAKAEVKLDASRLEYYKPGALLYQYKLVAADESRRVLSGSLALGTTRAGRIALHPANGTFLLVLSQATFGNQFDVNFKWMSNREVPPNNPPEKQVTLILHFRDIRNWDGVRFAGNEAYAIGMNSGSQWVGNAVKLEYPNIDTDQGSEVDVIVKANTVTVRAGKYNATEKLRQKLPARVGFSCVGEDGNPYNSLMVFGCTVKRGSGL